MPIGAELFVQAAGQLGIDTVFTLVGDHLNEVLVAAARAGMRIVDMRHESGVTHAADAWARIHRKPALLLVTGGPGHTNSLTGIATAMLAGSPLIAVSGSRARALAHRQAFQDIDQVEMARPVVKWAAEPPNAAQIPFYLQRAYVEANSGRKGAVHLTIPVDLFTESTHETSGRAWPGVDEPASLWGGPDGRPNSVGTAIEMLRGAHRPIVIAGSGVWWSHGENALRQFIERTNIPLYTITMGRAAVADDHPLVMGYADPALNHAVHAAFREADVFLIVGKRIDYRLAMGGARLFPAHAKFIQVDIHPQELGLNHALEAAICADARAALESLTAAAGASAWPAGPWLDRVRALREAWKSRLAADAADGASPLHPAAFFREARSALSGDVLYSDVLYSWDGGDFAHWGRAMLPALHAGGWLRLGPLGTIGSSLPNAIALQLAHPGRRVVAITGDGALGFYLAEMDTAVRHKLPIVVIVGNDAGWGLERELQSFAASGAASGVGAGAPTPGSGAVTSPGAGAPSVACELQSARYDLVMQAFGGAGETIERLEQVRPALQRAFASGVPYCVNVKIRGVRSPFTEWQIAGKKR